MTREGNGSAERLEELSRRADRQRLLLAESLSSVASDVRRHKTAWKFAGATATGLAAAATAAWKLFGRNSPAAQIGKAASGASLLLGLGKAFFRLKKFL